MSDLFSFLVLVFSIIFGSLFSDSVYFFKFQEGTHRIFATETRAVINGVDVGTSLTNDAFNVVITKGVPSQLSISGSPVVVYSSSIGGQLVASEVRHKSRLKF